MSFRLDPPVSVIIGVVTDRDGASSPQKNRVGAAVVAVDLCVSTRRYLDALPRWWGEWIERSYRMLNSGLPTAVERSPGGDILAMLEFAAYPSWMRLGRDLRPYLEDGVDRCVHVSRGASGSRCGTLETILRDVIRYE